MRFLDFLKNKIFNQVKHSSLEDKSPDLFIGKEMGDKRFKAKIVSINDENNFKIQVIALDDERFKCYVDLGEIYKMRRHTFWTIEEYKHLLFEIDPDTMKRDVSQFFLYWWEDTGWSWELDY